jgi:hypothetical protein
MDSDGDGFLDADEAETILGKLGMRGGGKTSRSDGAGDAGKRRDESGGARSGRRGRDQKRQKKSDRPPSPSGRPTSAHSGKASGGKRAGHPGRVSSPGSGAAGGKSKPARRRDDGGRGAGSRPSPSNFEAALFVHLDQDNDGRLSIGEVADTMSAFHASEREKGNAVDGNVDFMGTLDLDNDGFIDRDEARTFFDLMNEISGPDSSEWDEEASSTSSTSSGRSGREGGRRGEVEGDGEVEGEGGEPEGGGAFPMADEDAEWNRRMERAHAGRTARRDEL